MNSLVSYEWLKHYVDLKGITPDEFAKRVSLSGPAVEKIMPRGELLDKVVVGKIRKIRKHPNADKLKLAAVDVGTASLEVVCGGTNLVQDHFVAFAKIGAHVRWHGEGEPVRLDPAEIRGVKSQGMICAASEIGLEDAFPHDEHEILDLTESVPELQVKPGTPLADALGLSKDVILDMEVTSNRVDAMGMIGMAREASVILGKRFLWKPKEMRKPKSPSTPSAPLRSLRAGSPKPEISVTVHDKKLCPRYMAVRITGVKNGPSPWWMKERLMAAGMTSISLLVDITNYVMLEHAQPMHVFDAAKLRSGKKDPEIHVRLARAKEKITALDGKEYELGDRTLVIADAENPVAVAGIMGGEHSGVSPDATDIVFECATFDPVSVRRTSRRLNLYSDSQVRFEKGLSIQAVPFAMARAVELTLELAGGSVTDVSDERAGAYKPLSFDVTSGQVDDRMGVEIPQRRQIEILKMLGFGVKAGRGGAIRATVPWWRDHDIEAGVDLIEEIARVYGYGNVPAELPVGELPPRMPDAETIWEDRVKEIAKGAGLTEIYSYSFVSDDLYRKAGYDSKPALRLLNPLTEEFAFMRTSLLPSLLQIVADNQDRFKEQTLFEVSNVYYPTSKGWKDLPDERLEMGCAFLSDDGGFRRAKGFAEYLLSEFGMKDVSWSRLSKRGFWHPGRTVQAFVKGSLVATIGEVSPDILRNFKIEGRLALIDMPLEEVFAHAAPSKSYRAPNPFPESRRDLAIVVDEGAEYDDIARMIRRTDPLITDVEWFDTYRGKGLPDGRKSVAVHLTFASPERTLTAKEVDGLMERIALGLKEKFGAEVR
jgi:phenylalanyl-tRNA synthetase beta chain